MAISEGDPTEGGKCLAMGVTKKAVFPSRVSFPRLGGRVLQAYSIVTKLECLVSKSDVIPT